jgi:RHS repeat-associated protein
VFNSAGSLTHRYIHGPRIDQLLADEQLTAGQPGPGIVLWAITDHLGTARDIVDSAGTVVNHISYTSFGEFVGATNPSVEFAFGYTGREYEASITLYYNRARWLDPLAGRFVSVDPIREGMNWYAYVANGPLTATDPSGLESFWQGVYNVGAGVLDAAGEVNPFYRIGSAFNKAYNDPKGRVPLSAGLDAAAQEYVFSYTPGVLWSIGKGYYDAYNSTSGDVNDRMDRVVEHHFSHYSILGRFGRGLAAMDQGDTRGVAKEGAGLGVDVGSVGGPALAAKFAGKGLKAPPKGPPTVEPVPQRTAPPPVVEPVTKPPIGPLPESSPVSVPAPPPPPVQNAPTQTVPQIPRGSAGGLGAGRRIPQTLRDQWFPEGQTPPDCCYCRQNPAEHLDHVIPRSKNGDLTPDNIAPACSHCNTSKSARPSPVTPPANYVGEWPPAWQGQRSLTPSPR